MKKIAQLLGVFSLLMLLCSNVSQPGVYNSGGMAFTMLFPEDSMTYKKVQMREEKIFIQLYKGYAVVKGIYKMENTTQEKLSFKMGYPIKGIYNGGKGELNQVQLDSIYKFKIKTNGKEISIDQDFFEENEPVNTFGNSNWLTWQMFFLPKETLFVEVYFIVNSNSGKVTRGYNKKQNNSFIYLLESGSVWKQPIVKGNFSVELKDNLTLEDIDGVSEDFSFKKHPSLKVLYGQKNNFVPSPKDNLVITYFKPIENFDFKQVLKNEKALFDAIDTFSKTNIPTKLLDYESENPYEVPASLLGYLPIVLTYTFIYGPLVLIGSIGFIIFRVVYRKFKNLKK